MSEWLAVIVFMLILVVTIFVSVLFIENYDLPWAVAITIVLGVTVNVAWINYSSSTLLEQHTQEIKSRCIDAGGAYIDTKTDQCYDSDQRLVNTDLERL